MWGNNGRQGGQDLGSLTHRPTKAQMWGDNGRQKETRPRGSGQNIQHRLTCEDTMGDKGRQDVGKADGPSNKGKQEGRLETREVGENRGDKTLERRTHHPTHTHIVRRQWETRGDKGRQDTGTHVGRQWETKREDKTSKGRTPSNTSTRETMGDNRFNGRQG